MAWKVKVLAGGSIIAVAIVSSSNSMSTTNEFIYILVFFSFRRFLANTSRPDKAVNKQIKFHWLQYDDARTQRTERAEKFACGTINEKPHYA